MADRLRIVTFAAVEKRPTIVLDIEDIAGAGNYVKERDTFRYTPAPSRDRVATSDRRFGGSRTVGQAHDNAAVAATWRFRGSSQNDVLTKAGTFLREVNSSIVTGRNIEFRPEGASYPTYYELRGPGTFTPNYRWVEMRQGAALMCEAVWPVAPLGRGDCCDFWEDFVPSAAGIDPLNDYGFRTGAPADVSSSGNILSASANLAAEKRLIYVARGYTFADVQRTVGGTTPVAAATGFKLGTVLKEVGSDYVEVYVDDDGVNGRLRIDKVVGGTRTNLQSTNLPTRPSGGGTIYVRGRVQGNVVNAEYFTAAPSPNGGPTTAGAAYTLAVGAERTAFGSTGVGLGGLVWIPTNGVVRISSYREEPWTYRNQVMPTVIDMAGAIPGDENALADLFLSHSGGAAVPAWAMFGWTLTPSAAAPWGIWEAEAGSAGGANPPVVVADASYRGGNGREVATSGAGLGYVDLGSLAPQVMAQDDFQEDVSVEVWASVRLASGVVSPTITTEMRPTGAGVSGSSRYTEYGTVGKLLVRPASGTVKRFVRLGTVRLASLSGSWIARINMSWGVGSSGVFGVDYVVMVPVMRRMAMPSAKANNAAFPKFVQDTSEHLRIILSDGRGQSQLPIDPTQLWPDPSMGGAALELPRGVVSILPKLSSLVPDDPTADATTEQLSHTGTTHLRVIPRYEFARGA